MWDYTVLKHHSPNLLQILMDIILISTLSNTNFKPIRF